MMIQKLIFQLLYHKHQLQEYTSFEDNPSVQHIFSGEGNVQKNNQDFENEVELI
jgi:hypothetical protein